MRADVDPAKPSGEHLQSYSIDEISSVIVTFSVSVIHCSCFYFTWSVVEKASWVPLHIALILSIISFCLLFPCSVFIAPGAAMTQFPNCDQYSSISFS